MLVRSLRAIWVHSNYLIKNLTPFEDDAEIPLLDSMYTFFYKQSNLNNRPENL